MTYHFNDRGGLISPFFFILKEKRYEKKEKGDNQMGTRKVGR
jgi:hypothetical protein